METSGNLWKTLDTFLKGPYFRISRGLAGVSRPRGRAEMFYDPAAPGPPRGPPRTARPPRKRRRLGSYAAWGALARSHESPSVRLALTRLPPPHPIMDRGTAGVKQISVKEKDGRRRAGLRPPIGDRARRHGGAGCNDDLPAPRKPSTEGEIAGASRGTARADCDGRSPTDRLAPPARPASAARPRPLFG